MKIHQDLITRREALARMAAAAASLSLAVSMSIARRAEAIVEPAPDPEADNEILNALLSAEYDAIATYTAGAGIIVTDAATPQAVRDIVTDVALHFQSQHEEHAAALSDLITKNGGTPVDDPGLATIPDSFPADAGTGEVIMLAADKEKQAAYTYAQVMQSLSTQAAARLTAAIGGTETQHFVVLYLLAEGLIGANPNTAMNPTLVVPAAFVLDGYGTTSLENFPELDALLELDPPA